MSLTLAAEALALAVLRLDMRVMGGEPLAPREDVDLFLAELQETHDGDQVAAWHAYWREVDLRASDRA